VTPAKSGDQDVEIGDVLPESVNRRSLPVPGFSGKWNLAFGRVSASEDQDFWGVINSVHSRERKWNFLFNNKVTNP
jgi:hypothetical protein